MLELLFCVGLVVLRCGFDGMVGFLFMMWLVALRGWDMVLQTSVDLLMVGFLGGLLEFGFGGGLWFLFGFGGYAFADWLFVVGWCGCDGLGAVACGLLVLDFVLGV